MMAYDVEKLKKSQEYILNYIKNVCELNNIKYFLYFGSLLGAIRHNGYIPWDDDLDVACVREEYEKLVSILINNMEHNNEFYIQTLSTDPYSPVCHTKVRLNGTECIEKNVVSKEQHKGIFVDIFPLDEYKNTPLYIAKSKMIRLLYSIRGDIVFQRKNKPMYKKMLIKLLGRKVDRYNYWIEQLMASKNQCDRYTCYICRYPADKCAIAKEWIENIVTSKFENELFSIPANYMEILKTLYGENYMDLPPEDERITHEYQTVIWNI